MTSSSSIPAKIGSDVNYLVFEILPRLKPGVVVHVHDVMWPFEYPKQWLMERRAWNETCIVRAFLQYNEALSFSSTAMQATAVQRQLEKVRLAANEWVLLFWLRLALRVSLAWRSFWSRAAKMAASLPTSLSAGVI